MRTSTFCPTRNVVTSVCKVVNLIVLGATFLLSIPNGVSAQEFGDPDRRAEGVGLIALLADGSSYDGKLVRTVGVLRIEFEGNGLYLTKEHYVHLVFKSSVWIEMDYSVLGTTEELLARHNGCYVLVEGVFVKDDAGHLDGSAGAIRSVTRVMVRGGSCET